MMCWMTDDYPKEREKKHFVSGSLLELRCRHRTCVHFWEPSFFIAKYSSSWRYSDRHGKPLIEHMQMIS